MNERRQGLEVEVREGLHEHELTGVDSFLPEGVEAIVFGERVEPAVDCLCIMAVVLCTHMRRTTVMLPAELKARAERRAYELGVSFGELVRETLQSALESGPERRTEDPLFTDEATYQGKTPKDMAKRHDEYLYGDEAE